MTRKNKMEAFSADIERKIKALVKVGIYSSEMDVIKDAIKNLFREKSDLNVSAAIELYREGQISLNKAAEMAGMSAIGFKELLINRGFTWEIEARPCDEMDKKLKKYM